MQKIIKKFEKAGAKVEKLEGFGHGSNDHKATFKNGKVGYFDNMAFWHVTGYDSAIQETERCFRDNATQLIKWALK
jgi:hypothetical protein